MNIAPIMPSHPARSGLAGHAALATSHVSVTPKAVLSIAAIHSDVDGRSTLDEGSRKAAASIPGHANRYASERER
jgi:hypothetical protein